MNYKELYSISESWVSKQMKSFTTIDLSNFLKTKEIVIAGSLKGKLIKDLISNDLIKQNGFVKLKNKRKQLTEYKLYISLQYRLKQQKNASKNNDCLTFDL
jgi:hypothetical protein